MRKAIATAAALAQGRDVPPLVEFPINVSEPIATPAVVKAQALQWKKHGEAAGKGEEVGRFARLPGGDAAITGRLGSYGGRSEMRDPQYRFSERERRNVDVLIAQALAEDLGQIGDITSTAIIPSYARGAARVVARSPGVLAGHERRRAPGRRI